MPNVFISHSWDDNDIARRLAQQLKRDGAEVWIDYARISGGDSLPKRIGDAIDWCDTLILLWSASANSSYWVNTEWETAVGLKKHIIPCVLDGTVLPVVLRRLLYIPLQKFDEGYVQLLCSFGLPVQESVFCVNVKPIHTNALSPEQLASPTKTEINGTGEKKVTPNLSPRFRQKPSMLSTNDVKTMLAKHNFYCKANDWTFKYCHPVGEGFTNNYELQTIRRSKLVISHASSLVWQQSGSANCMTHEDVEKWIKSLNKNGYAGFNDWRLPTLEEAMTLMEARKYGNLYIDPLFDEKQRTIWTGDKVEGQSWTWVVDFDDGHCDSNFFSVNWTSTNYVRAVRSMQSSAE